MTTATQRRPERSEKKKTIYAGKSQTQKREGILSLSEGEMQVK
jgi:hypothetical protein